MLRSDWLRGGLVAIAMLASGCSKSETATLTLCSAAHEAIEFVVTADKAEPGSRTGSLAPGGRVTLPFRPRSEGGYAIDLRRGHESVRHADVGYYSPRATDTFTVKADLTLAAGCDRAGATSP